MVRSFILDLKRGALLGSRIAPVIQPRRRYIRMPQPLLHFGNVRIMRQCVRRCRRAKRVHTEPVHIDRDTYRFAVALHDLLIDRFGMKGLSELACCVVLDRSNNGPSRSSPCLAASTYAWMSRCVSVETGIKRTLSPSLNLSDFVVG